jgi:hypothetical protein
MNSKAIASSDIVWYVNMPTSKNRKTNIHVKLLTFSLLIIALTIHAQCIAEQEGIQSQGTQREKYAFCNITHGNFIQSFAQALEAGKSEVYLNDDIFRTSTSKKIKELLKKVDRLEVTRSEYLGGDCVRKDYRILFVDGKSLDLYIEEIGVVWKIVWVRPGQEN